MPDLLDRMPKLPDPAQMRQWDQGAVKFGIPEFTLMENAAQSALAVFRIIASPISGKRICLLAGSGNNGGDAACLARYLADSSAAAIVFYIRKPATGDIGAAARNFSLAISNLVPFLPLFPQTPKPLSLHIQDECTRHLGGAPQLLVDGLLGTGFHGQLNEKMLAAVNACNEIAELFACPTLALDVPSGLNAISGLPSPVCVKATATVAMAAAKPGLLLPHARQWTGLVYARPIGMPRVLEPERSATTRLLDGRILLNPHSPPANSYKNVFGHVFIFGGAHGMAGAARLTSLGCLRAGAGLVTACAPKADIDQIRGDHPEIMTQAVTGAQDAEWPETIPPSTLAAIKGASALVIGPGLGRGDDSVRFLNAFLNINGRPPTVFDADALTIMGENPEWRQYIRADDILTPHPGEAGTLLNEKSVDIQADRPLALRKLTSQFRAVCVLKGAGTLLAQGDGPVLLCPYDIPQLAIAGAGDVLSGCLGAHLALGEPAINAAALGVIGHAMAGLILARAWPNRGGLASDLANALAEVPQFVADQPTVPLFEGICPWP